MSEDDPFHGDFQANDQSPGNGFLPAVPPSVRPLLSVAAGVAAAVCFVGLWAGGGTTVAALGTVLGLASLLMGLGAFAGGRPGAFGIALSLLGMGLGVVFGGLSLILMFLASMGGGSTPAASATPSAATSRAAPESSARGSTSRPSTHGRP